MRPNDNDDYDDDDDDYNDAIDNDVEVR